MGGLQCSYYGLRSRFRLEIGIWYGQRTSVTTTVGRTSRGSPDRLARAEGLWGEAMSAPSERHFWARNAPYVLRDPADLLKSQRMRPPFERTINPHVAFKSLSYRPCSLLL